MFRLVTMKKTEFQMQRAALMWYRMDGSQGVYHQGEIKDVGMSPRSWDAAFAYPRPR